MSWTNELHAPGVVEPYPRPAKTE